MTDDEFLRLPIGTILRAWENLAGDRPPSLYLVVVRNEEDSPLVSLQRPRKEEIVFHRPRSLAD